ncbi:hypothetical protein HPB47_017926 [Ixodes persulcatus]|uniref:Uncharacterized protein n=1 Tax=Ixodes persulcatus TaxID=34615 RepID=A0AC60QM90_IXOPE|nr:hypothetical protein HPB47_017926 [Ixodes persulcatus]
MNKTAHRRLDTCFEEAARKNSKRTAVLYDDGDGSRSLTYLQVSQLASEVAAEILLNGAPPETVPCLCRKSLYTVPAILGILKASCSFAFLDVENSGESLQALQEFIPVSLLLADELLYSQSPLSKSGSWEVLGRVLNETHVLAKCLGTVTDTKASERAADPEMAYTMWTSGSTGDPKTVQVPHSCIVPNVLHLRKVFNITPEDVICGTCPFTFDPIVIQVFLALTSGATLLLPSDVIGETPSEIVKLVTAHKVSFLQATPSFFFSIRADLLKKSLLSQDTSLRILALGGEECPPVGVLKRWKGNGNATQLFNLYGITEVSCWATCQKIDLGTNGAVPLGNPLAGTVLELRKDSGEIIEEGEGTLFVGGTNRRCLVGNETWQDVDPLLLRDSGDRVKKCGNAFTFLDRNDSSFQYNGRKVRGNNVTAILLRSPSVETCRTHFSKGERMLYIFATLSPGCVAEDALPSLTKSIETECLCPFEIVAFSSSPLTRHGKLDLKALLKTTSEKMNHAAAYNRLLSTLWKEYLQNLYFSLEATTRNWFKNHEASLTSWDICVAELKADLYKPTLTTAGGGSASNADSGTQ